VEIARPLARGRLDLESCVREDNAPPQMALPWDARQRNIRGAFRCRRAILGATVAVVDDVMTSGATLNELARTLKRAGATRVVNWVFARTLPPA
jgi:predicted amidophosphoribosyltransferase